MYAKELENKNNIKEQRQARTSDSLRNDCFLSVSLSNWEEQFDWRNRVDVLWLEHMERYKLQEIELSNLLIK